MAQLEAADRTFSRFQAVSETVKEVSRDEVIARHSLTEMIDALVAEGTIPSEMRPSNGRRLGETIFSSIHRDYKRDCTKPREVIRLFIKSQGNSFPRSVSLFQLAIVALHEARLLDGGTTNRPRRYDVTDELITLFPSAALIPHRIKID
jgi:hypothetical protein